MKFVYAALLLALPFAASAQEENKYGACAEQVKQYAKANLDLKAKAKGADEATLATEALYRGELDFGAEGSKEKIGVFFVGGAIKDDIALVAIGMDAACDPKIIQFPAVKE